MNNIRCIKYYILSGSPCSLEMDLWLQSWTWTSGNLGIIQALQLSDSVTTVRSSIPLELLCEHHLVVSPFLLTDRLFHRWVHVAAQSCLVIYIYTHIYNLSEIRITHSISIYYSCAQMLHVYSPTKPTWITCSWEVSQIWHTLKGLRHLWTKLRMPRFFLRKRGGWLAAFYEEIHLYDAELAKALLSINLSLYPGPVIRLDWYRSLLCLRHEKKKIAYPVYSSCLIATYIDKIWLQVLVWGVSRRDRSSA